MLRAFLNQNSGYGASKWVAEYLVRSERDKHGLPIQISQPGMVTGHSEFGIMNNKDYVSRYLSTCLQIGYGINENVSLDMTPVDYVAKMILSNDNKEKKLLQLCNPFPLTYKEICLAIGVQGVSLDEWLDLVKLHDDSKSLAIAPLVTYMEKHGLVFSEEADYGSEAWHFETPNLLQVYTNYLARKP
mmetsp:Transcript_19725/g.25555  ORF Transcript_19725/g.25555 Transcript_19725/m.25555 type:complete len:187 (-) Transcript_19725:1653-2213(-)